MLLEHLGKSPRIHETAYIAPTAVVCGDVEVGENCRVLFGATLVAEGGTVMPELTRRYANALGRHLADRVHPEESS
jgi:hypothetical protein